MWRPRIVPSATGLALEYTASCGRTNRRWTGKCQLQPRLGCENQPQQRLFGSSRETEGFFCRCPRTANREAVRKCPQERKSFSLSSLMNNNSVIRRLIGAFSYIKTQTDLLFTWNIPQMIILMPAVLLLTTWWQCRAEHADTLGPHTHTHTHISTHSQVLHQIPERSQGCAAQVPAMSNLMAFYFALSASRLLRHRTAAERQQRETSEDGGMRAWWSERCVGGFEKQRGTMLHSARRQGWGVWSSAETVTPGNSCSASGPDRFHRAPELTRLPQVSALTKTSLSWFAKSTHFSERSRQTAGVSR